MFSWKNIKDTFNDKVKNSESTKDKTLGLAEVIGKTVVAGATKLAQEAPSLLLNLSEANNDQIKKNAKEVINDPNETIENKQKAKSYLNNIENIQSDINERKQGLDNYRKSFNYADRQTKEQNKEENKEFIENKISSLEAVKKIVTKRMKNLRRDKFELNQAINNFKNIDEENLIIQKISDIDTNYKNYEKELYNLNKNLEKIKKRMINK